ncbi:hypothetical protein LJR219_003594 [Phenylobacterium sp. LjRoot219]|uniref:hypothetical protein n=1 Tax=Phenylobacterium sp. LjRoot219 TaxID=3342283 RepID=UPI003ED14848
MKQALSRPAPVYAAGAGLFRNDHFQMAYATTDMVQAKALFSKRYGVKEWRPLEGALPAGGQIHIELGWAGGTMYELVWADGPGSEVFRAGLPADGFAIRHHHLGYYVPTAEAWAALKAEVAQQGLKVLHVTDVPGFLQAIIVDTPELGHYLEYIFPEQAGVGFFEGTPSN